MTGREDHDGLVKPMAHVVAAHRRCAPARRARRTSCGSLPGTRLAEYKRPRWIEFVDALPTTATGKIQRFKLRGR